MLDTQKPPTEFPEAEFSHSKSTTISKSSFSPKSFYKWLHIPSNLTLAWLLISIPLVIWVHYYLPPYLFHIPFDDLRCRTQDTCYYDHWACREVPFTGQFGFPTKSTCERITYMAGNPFTRKMVSQQRKHLWMCPKQSSASTICISSFSEGPNW